ncbi:uncharacterized protein LOC123440885 isoform X2 [Hordeum vulgare subsp. vulgare]|uniref:uncharacterized protein LOC123440885 isoform X2 n=1 Tax=Hordeum vulgare subsp. vulgare TaxID=112509 RepID=UPI001D1A45B2|nr:uncharacterized protein LOC123440885 isoform X2 [Hordeum vulgare subsp. vulgare]
MIWISVVMLKSNDILRKETALKQATGLGERRCRCHVGLRFRSMPRTAMPHHGYSKCWLRRGASRGSSVDGRCGQTSRPRRMRRSLWASESIRRRGCCLDPEHGRRMEPPRSCTLGVNGKMRLWQRISKAMALATYGDNHTVYCLDLIHVTTYIIHGLERRCEAQDNPLDITVIWLILKPSFRQGHGCTLATSPEICVHILHCLSKLGLT